LYSKALLQSLQAQGVLFYALYACHRLPHFIPTEQVLQAMETLDELSVEMTLLKAQLLSKVNRFQEADLLYEQLKNQSNAVDPSLIQINQSAYRDVPEDSTVEILFNKSLRQEDPSDAIALLQHAEELANILGEDTSEIKMQLDIFRNSSSSNATDYYLSKSTLIDSAADIVRLNNFLIQHPSRSLAKVIFSEITNKRSPIRSLTMSQRNTILLNLLKLSLHNLAPFKQTAFTLNHFLEKDHDLVSFMTALKMSQKDLARDYFEKIKDLLSSDMLLAVIQLMIRVKVVPRNQVPLFLDSLENRVSPSQKELILKSVHIL
jgi:tetratricopeptide (TPR) repeat protein